jgi:BASS family bile acid:Na+ symporter
MANSDSLLMPIAIGIIMLGIGLNLEFDNFKTVFKKPKSMISGLVGQMIVVPLVAFIIAWIYPLDPIYKVGLVLIAACPGGTASNLVTYILKGKTELSVSLTTINSFIIVFSIPLIVQLALNVFLGKDQPVDVSFSSTAGEVTSTVLLPVLVGMTVNHYKPEFTSKLREPLRYILPAILLLVFGYVLFSTDKDTFGVSEFVQLAVPGLLLNLGVMMISFLALKRILKSRESIYTIAIEMGLQNSALAIFIATNVIENNQMALIAVVYSSFSFFSTFIIAWFYKYRVSKNNKS